jgi:hypothetical protein
MKGDPEVRSVFDAWREQGDQYLRDALIGGRLATQENAERRAWVLRQVIWATFISELLAGGFEAEELQRRARDAATTLLEGPWR